MIPPSVGYDRLRCLSMYVMRILHNLQVRSFELKYICRSQEWQSSCSCGLDLDDERNGRLYIEVMKMNELFLQMNNLRSLSKKRENWRLSKREPLYSAYMAKISEIRDS